MGLGRMERMGFWTKARTFPLVDFSLFKDTEAVGGMNLLQMIYFY